MRISASLERLLSDMTQQMSEWHKIMVDGVPQVRRGRVNRIQVVVEDRQGGRKAHILKRTLFNDLDRRYTKGTDF